ncbi:MAG: radical SAM protein [candidate division WOR-3 bacterium]
MLQIESLPQKPIFIDWAITTNCYLTCTHCRYLTLKGKRTRYPELNSQEAEVLASKIAESSPQWVLIEGGEPLLRKDIFQIIKVLKAKNFALPVFIISSGMGFTKALASNLASVGAKVLISVDSVDPDIYQKIRQGADFVEMINAILIAQEEKILDSINVTLQPANAQPQEITRLGRFLDAMGIKKVNFLGLKPVSSNLKHQHLVAELPKLFSSIVSIQNRYNLEVYVDEPFYKAWCQKNKTFSSPKETAGPIVVEERAGCIFGEYLFVEPDGKLKPCSFSPVTIEELGWDEIIKIQDKKNRHGKCGKCKYQAICGGCRVRSYVLTGDWYATDPYCPL